MSAGSIERFKAWFSNTDKARGTAAAAAPEKRAARVNPEPPERHSHMLQETMVQPTKNGKASTSPRPLFSDANAQHARRAKAWLAERIEAAKKLPPNELISEVVTITPAMAELILLHHNEGNRAIRRKRVEQWTDTINEGRMKLVAQGISFARDGRLNNGQHRLSAIVAAGRPALMNVTFGEDRGVYDVIDSGAPRGGSDTLKIAGFQNTAALAAGVRSYLAITVGPRAGKAIGNDVIHATVEAHPGLADAAADALKIVKALRCASGPTVAALYLITTQTRHAAHVDTFVERLCDGAELKKGDPILVLRDGLGHRSFGMLFHTESRATAISAAIVRAWNLWVTKRTANPKKLAWHPGQPFPDVE